MQEMTFLFDTGSSWLWISNEDCPKAQCQYRHYNYKESTSYRTDRKTEKVKYAAGKIEGFVATDHVALTKSEKTQAKDVNFLSIYEIKEMSYLLTDGLLGLSPPTSRKGKTSGEDVHLFITELKNDGVIDAAIFSLYMDDGTH